MPLYQRHYASRTKAGHGLRYPWRQMQPGDYYIDTNAIPHPTKDNWWQHGRAHAAAVQYAKYHADKGVYFTGRAERDGAGNFIGVRTTRELGRFMRTADAMWSYIRNTSPPGDIDAIRKLIEMGKPYHVTLRQYLIKRDIEGDTSYLKAIAAMDHVSPPLPQARVTREPEYTPDEQSMLQYICINGTHAQYKASREALSVAKPTARLQLLKALAREVAEGMQGPDSHPLL